MKIEQDIKLDFSDVLIRPKRSTLESRSEIQLERDFKFPHSSQIWKGIPIIASNMDTVGTPEMYHSLKNYNLLTCFHKFIDIDDYPENDRNNYMISIGIRDQDFNKLKELENKQSADEEALFDKKIAINDEWNTRIDARRQEELEAEKELAEKTCLICLVILKYLKISLSQI